jgi:integrase
MPIKLYKRPNGIFHLRGTVQGRRIDQSARTRDRAEANAIRANLEADEFKRAVYGDKAVATFAEAALRYMRAGGSPDHLTPLIARFGNRRLAEVDQALLDELAGERPQAKASTLIRQIYTPALAVMNFAHEQKLCDHIRIRKPVVKAARVDFLTPKEAKTLLALLPAHLQPIVTFYLATGCRATEALDLRWRDVSPGGERVVFWETKGGYSRGVDIQGRARGALPARGKPDDFVWLNSRGEPWHAYDAVNLMMRRYCETAGFRHVHLHLFRHTWATWAYACNRDLTFLMQQGGWRSATMVMRYAHSASDDLAREVLSQGWEFPGSRTLPKRPNRPKIK